MYRKCTVDLVPKGVFRPPNAIGVNGKKQGYPGTKKPPKSLETPRVLNWLREPDLNRRPSGYEPDELPGCSIPRKSRSPSSNGRGADSRQNALGCKGFFWALCRRPNRRRYSGWYPDQCQDQHPYRKGHPRRLRAVYWGNTTA